MKLSSTLLAFNRGLVSRLGLARVDVKRIASLSADTMTNFIPRVLGSMSIRPGWKYLGGIQGNNAGKLIPFVFAVDDTAIIEVTNGYLRVWWVDELITRGTVGTGVVNGTFTTDLSSWTDSDEAGATSSWLTGGYMQLLGDGTNAAIREQEVTVAGGDASDEHGLRVTIAKGPVSLRVGSTSGAENYVAETSLGTGVHSLAFTPTGNFFVRFSSRLSRPVTVDTVEVEAAGVMAIPVPWDSDDLDNLRWDQSGDIIFVACADTQPQMIERRSVNSWSVVKYEPDDGPFRVENVTATTIAASAITGSVTLTASSPLFRTGHIGALYSITSEGQRVESNISAQNTFTNAIRITGVDSSRVFTIILEGTWSATVTLQRSLEADDGPWEDVTSVSWTANTTETYDDGLDNQIAWYRIGVKTGQYTSGTVEAALDYSLGGITGIVRITAYSSALSVTADVLRDLGGTDATAIWAESDWSDYRGWPTAVALHESRLWWAGKSRLWGSVTDGYDSFDPDIEGDSGPISRGLGVGPVDRINWLFSSQRLLIGGDLNEYAARSSSLDEPLTPTAFNVKVTSSQGSAAIMPGRIDSKAVFANRTGMKVFEDTITQGTEYSATDLCQLVPEIGDPEIVRLAVQRQPDTRIHAIRSDGTVALAVFDRSEDVLGWCEIETDGEVEDVAVLPAQPGVTDDYIYYIVKRTIEDVEVRYLEKWAQASTTRGGFGLGGGSPYLTYDRYDVELTDLTDQLAILYSDPQAAFYLAGPANDVIWKHPDASFPAGATQVDPGVDIIRITGQSGAMSQDGTLYWLSGDSGYPVRAVTLATGATQSFGNSDKIIHGYRDGYLIVYEGGNSYAYQPNFGTSSLGAIVRTWLVNANNSISFILTWDADGWGWTFDGGQNNLIRFNPTVAAYRTDQLPPGRLTTTMNCVCPVAYDSTRNAIIVAIEDTPGIGAVNPGLWRYTNWSASADSAGTWERISASDALTDSFQAIWYDAADDIIFAQTSSAVTNYSPGVRRFTGDGEFIDFIFIDISNPLAEIPYTMEQSRHVYYRDNYGWITGTTGGLIYLIRVSYNGPQIVTGPEGDDFLPGGSVGRLHNLADSYINYEGVPITVVTGLDHIEGESVVVWANGIDEGTTSSYGQTYTVSGGQITLPTATTNITVGLPYTAQYKTSKLGLQTQAEILFGKDKRITEVALVLADTHHLGLRFGPDFTNLDDRPQREEWADVAVDTVDEDYDSEPIQFPSTWSPDTRLCLQAQAPRPCTVLAVQITMEV